LDARRCLSFPQRLRLLPRQIRATGGLNFERDGANFEIFASVDKHLDEALDDCGAFIESIGAKFFHHGDLTRAEKYFCLSKRVFILIWNQPVQQNFARLSRLHFRFLVIQV